MYASILCRYNTSMKLVFLGTSFSIIYFMRFHPSIRATYDKEQDTFRSIFLLVPCAVLALIINQERTAVEVRWSDEDPRAHCMCNVS